MDTFVNKIKGMDQVAQKWEGSSSPSPCTAPDKVDRWLAGLKVNYA